MIYHTIRGQELIKLYIIYNMLEVADRLIASIGQDTMDTLFWSIANPKPLQLIFHFFLAVLYMFMHSFIMLLQATTLNVAFNNHNKVLLIIMMSNNFIELKGSVFKRFEKNNLFQVNIEYIVGRWRPKTYHLQKYKFIFIGDMRRCSRTISLILVVIYCSHS